MALFEANASHGQYGLKGEWLHPPASRILQENGIRFNAQAHSTKGFVVFPEDGSQPIPLTYPEGSHGMVCPHETLVLSLQEAVKNEPNVDFIWNRAHPKHDGSVTYTENGVAKSVIADRIVGADGRGSVVLRLLGLTTKPTVVSRMVGVRMTGAELPLEDYGHLICGGPRPIFMYGLGKASVCAIVDIPHEFSSQDAVALLLKSYAPILPADLRPSFVEALDKRHIRFAGNTIRPRISYGSPRFAVIGDAAGHYHPMTAVGLTLGFGDAIALAESENFSDFVDRRFRETRAPEMLAMGMYEIFADHRQEALALRHAAYRIWRKGGAGTHRSVRMLACEDTSQTSLGFMGAAVVSMAVARTIPLSLNPRKWFRACSTIRRLFSRVGWFIRAVLQLRKSRAKGEVQNQRFYDNLGRAFLTSAPHRNHPDHSPD